MNCSQFQQWLEQGCPATSPQDREAFDEHRAHCQTCAQHYQLDQLWQNALREGGTPTDDGQAFAQAVLDRATGQSPASLESDDKPSSPEAFCFKRHWLPLSLAALLAMGLLSGLWLKLQQKPGSQGNSIATHHVQPFPGEVVGQMVRQVQTQWVVQPRAWLEGMPKVNLPLDWQTWLTNTPNLWPDPAQLIQPETQHDLPEPL